jgi:indole-3-glycerol phosphate synthase
MNKLQEIVIEKRKQVEEDKRHFPVEMLKRSFYYKRECVSLQDSLAKKDKSGIIAEIKKKSPALGEINPDVTIKKLSVGYAHAGASALSVLTDRKFFGGSNADLATARKYNSCPILRKDFVIDAYQVIEAKSIGADAILLIAAILSKEEIVELTDLAHALGMEVLLEFHAQVELEKVYEKVDIIGVNNRNLETMKIDNAMSKTMAKLLPIGIIKISESGIEDPITVLELKKLGYDGFLIGSYFMTHREPAKACAEFIQQINTLKNDTDAT